MCRHAHFPHSRGASFGDFACAVFLLADFYLAYRYRFDFYGNRFFGSTDYWNGHLPPPIYYFRGRINGAPFHVGDHVQILVGPNRDRIVRVEAVWENNRQVCVELGDSEKKGVQVPFDYTEVCRAVLPNKSLQATAAVPASCD
jgi:hypothetical protein